MARMAGARREKTPWTARLLLGAIRRRMGRLPETWPIVAHVPKLLRGWSLWELHLDRARHLDPKLRRLAELKVALMVGCPF